MASRGSRPRFRVQRLPLGLFGFNRADVLELATRIEAEQQGANDAFATVEADQRERIIRTLARRDALGDLLQRLRLDRERLSHQLELARRNATVIDTGVREEVSHLEALHHRERARLEGFLPEVDRAIAVAEQELRKLAAGIERVVGGAIDDALGTSTEFADVAAALLAQPPGDLPVRRLSGERTLFLLPERAVRLQVRGAPSFGYVTGVVVSGPPPRVLGFVAESEEGSGVIPVGDVVALRQGMVLLRDKYRLLDLDDVPEESTRALFPVALPPKPQAPEGEGALAEQEVAAAAAPVEASAAAPGDDLASGGATSPSSTAPGDVPRGDLLRVVPPAGAAPTVERQIEESPSASSETSIADEELQPAPTETPALDGDVVSEAHGAVEMVDLRPMTSGERLQAEDESEVPSRGDSSREAADGRNAPPMVESELDELPFAAGLRESATPQEPQAPEAPPLAIAPEYAASAEDEQAAPLPSAHAAEEPAPDLAGHGPFAAMLAPSAQESVLGQTGPEDGTAPEEPVAASCLPMDDSPELAARSQPTADPGGGELPRAPAPSVAREEQPPVDQEKSSPAPQSEERPAEGKNETVPEAPWPEELPRPAWQLPGESGDAGSVPLRVGQPQRAYEIPRTEPARPQAPRPQTPPPRPAQRPAATPAEPMVVAGASGLNILAFIAGKVVGRDLVGQDGRLVAAQGTRITPELVAEVEAMGLLPEMIVYMTLPEDGQ